MGNVHTYALTKDLKKKPFVLENKHQKEQLFGKM